MIQRRDVRTIAAAIPHELKEMRGRMMLESEQEFLGVDEVACPACGGSGWLNLRRLERCPVCCGFCEVPEGLANWYRAKTAVYHEGHEGHEGRREGDYRDTTSTTKGGAMGNVNACALELTAATTVAPFS
jgi:hypothetical protein